MLIIFPNNGIFSAKQAKLTGMSYMRLSRLAKSGKLQRMARGVYESVDKFDDLLCIEQLRRPRIVYSHDTALYLHDLIDRDPSNFSVTVPTGYNTKGLRNEGFKVFSLKSDLYESDILQLPTKYDHLVNVYTAERTIVDCVRSRNRMCREILTNALKWYAMSRNRNLPQLMRIAKQFGVANLMSTYMEVLA
ncbi:MAG: type IV toxin-antitoxin system AbiEi family antitoxin domain-containing protein [Deltaproteobacteria bacterium]|jgi:predicted transcriptional regulator of viral defense system|nr:type IV toxin-antitoxin system AbiEi family antitoxin domain-containing protein [Deltaproteobacteria bacterium]